MTTSITNTATSMRALLGVLLCCFFSSALHAAPPSIVQYQGRVSVDGENFDGTGHFKFAIVATTDAGQNTFLWSVNNSVISIPVSNGHFSVGLGDVAIPGMPPLPSTAALFNNGDGGLRLRVAFSSNPAGPFEPILPERRFTSSLFALNADQARSVLDGAIGADQLADGAVGASKIAPNAIGADRIASGAIEAVHLSEGAIGTQQLADGSITTDDLHGDLLTSLQSVWTANGSDIYRLNSNVGIGTMEPKSNLHVAGGGDASLQPLSGRLLIGVSPDSKNIVFDENEILARNSGKPSALYVNGEGGNVFIGDEGIGTEGFSKAANLALRNGDLHVSGKIGIGTTEPVEALQIGHIDDTSSNYLSIKTDGGKLYRGGIRMRVDDDNVGFTIENDDREPDGNPQGLHIRRHENSEPGETALFVKRSNGNVGIGTANPFAKLHVDGKIIANHDVEAKAVLITSNRDAKAGFEAVDSQGVLRKVVEMPISRWHYKGEEGIKHIGPMAQDFVGAFGTGSDDKHIATVDSDGVALAAIQGLYRLVQEKDAEIDSLKERLLALETTVAAAASN